MADSPRHRTGLRAILQSLGRRRRSLGERTREEHAIELLPQYAEMLDEAIGLAETLQQQSQPEADTKPENPPTTTAEANTVGPQAPGTSWDGEVEIFQFPGPVTNPYVDLLYRDAATHGVAVRHVQSLEQLPSPSSTRIVHVHWTSRIQAGCATAEAAALRSSRAIEQLGDWQAAGGRVIWTVHEPLPHDCAFPEVETRFRRALAQLTDVTHVLHRATAELCEPLFPLRPETTVVATHPLYDGVYPSWMSRTEARARLGLDDEYLLVAFGAIRPYKRLDRVLDGHRTLLASGTASRLIIAGPMWKAEEQAEFLASAATTPGVTVFDEPVADDDVQLLFRAADLIPVAYDDFLNSGVVMLALTFGAPVLAPENPVTAELAGRFPGLRLWGPEQTFSDAVTAAHEQRASETHEPRTDEELAHQSTFLDQLANRNFL